MQLLNIKHDHPPPTNMMPEWRPPLEVRRSGLRGKITATWLEVESGWDQLRGSGLGPVREREAWLWIRVKTQTPLIKVWRIRFSLDKVLLMDFCKEADFLFSNLIEFNSVFTWCSIDINWKHLLSQAQAKGRRECLDKAVNCPLTTALRQTRQIETWLGVLGNNAYFGSKGSWIVYLSAVRILVNDLPPTNTWQCGNDMYSINFQV